MADSDYYNGLMRARENYILNYVDSRTGKDTGVSLGLGAPTFERQIAKAAEETGSYAAGSLAGDNIIVQDNQPDVVTDAPFEYELQFGDTLSELSEKYKIPVAQILRLNKGNPAIKDADLIYAGGTIRLARPNLDKFVPTDQPFAQTNIDVMMKGLADKYNPPNAKFKIPYEFIKAIGTQESNLKYAEGADDEKGIMQVRPIALEDVNSYYDEFKRVPITMEQLTRGSETYNVDKSIEAGVAYLAMMRDKYGAKNLKEVAAMYNGGPNAVRSGNKQANAYSNSVLAIMETVEPFKFSDKSAASITMGEGTDLEPQAKVDTQTKEVLAIDRGKGISNQLEQQRNFKLVTEKLKKRILEAEAVEDFKAQQKVTADAVQDYIEQLKADPMYEILQETFGTEYGEKLKERILRKKGVKGAIP
jgi:LysM repeat protein